MSSHSHDHHSHVPETFNRAFAIGISLNLVFVFVEVVFGVFAQSLALIADAGHNLSDVFTLVLAWGANYLASRKPTSRRTYGYRRVPILASLFSALLLLMALGGITWEAVGRFQSSTEVNGTIVIVVASIGVVINTATALLFLSGQKNDLNIRGAFLHMAADAAVSLGVVIGGVIVLFTDATWVDPLITLFIVIVILVSTLGLLKDSVSMAIDSVPSRIDPSEVEAFLGELQGVQSVHDLHIWGMSTTEIAITVHLVMPTFIADGVEHDQFLQNLSEELHRRFDIDHMTIQIERGEGELCKQACPGSL